MAKPVVDRVETQLDGRAQVVRLDMWSQVGRQAARRYGVRGIPTLMVVDNNGQPVYGQYGIPLPSQVIGQVDNLLASAN